MSLKVPVIALAQLNRNMIDSKTGETRVPVLADLKNSSAIVEDSNAVLLLHVDDDDLEKPIRTMLLRIAKNRSGRSGSIIMKFRANVMKILETDNGIEIPLSNEFVKVEDNIFES